MFLLLIFFMVSSVFRNNAGIDITLPSASTATEQQEAPYKILIQESGAITFRDTPGISIEELESQMRELLAQEPDARIALSADGDARTEEFVAVLDLARRVGGKQLIIATQRPEPENIRFRNPIPHASGIGSVAIHGFEGQARFLRGLNRRFGGRVFRHHLIQGLQETGARGLRIRFLRVALFRFVARGRGSRRG